MNEIASQETGPAGAQETGRAGAQETGGADLPVGQDTRQRVPTAATPAEIDASCRAPLAVLFGGAVFWLVVGSVLALIASIKFHAPGFLANEGWAGYGRLHAAASSAQLYGFALQAGFGVALWIFARLGGNRVSQPWLIGFGGKLWNLGVLVGVVAILAGAATSFENLEMPHYAGLILFAAFLVMGLWTLLTFAARRESRLSPPQWFLLTALLWFPWIFSTANLLLLVFPVRGVTQSIIAWWYSENLTFVWLSLVGLAAAFYFIPKLTRRALHSEYLALYTFWSLLLFGGWAVVPASAPVPAWLPSLSTVARVLIVIPLLTVAVNVFRTVTASQRNGGADPPAGSEQPPVPTAPANFQPALWFIGFGLAAWLVAGAMKVFGALPDVAAVTQFTWFNVAESQLNSFGFFAMTMFGAIYCIAPLVAGLDWPSRAAVKAHFWFAAIGILLIVVPLAVGGVIQGHNLNDAQMPFVDVTNATLPFLRASSLGDTFICIGNLLLAANLAGLFVRFALLHVTPVCKTAMLKLEPMEAKP